MSQRKLNKTNLLKLQDFAFGTIAVSSLFLLLNVSGANATTSSVDSVSIEVPVACTMTSTVNTAHTATANVGTYQENIGETTFDVICNDANGFSVYAIGYSGDTYGDTTMKPSTLAVSNAIATGTATSGDTSNWAMKLTAVTGDYTPTLETGFNAYHVVPAEYTKVASYSSNTDSSSGSSFKSTYAAYVASAQPADTYTGKVKYTVVHPANGEAPEIPVTMQNMEASVCTTTPKTVYDNRDNHAYVIQRLADGKCWMMENLDLGRTELTTDLTSANTNIENTVTAETFNSWVKSSGSYLFTTAELIPITGTDSTSNTPYGTLYNYCAASAGTICFASNSNNDDAIYDICPAGWRLPTGGNSGEFQSLYSLTDYNTNAKMRAPIADSGAAFALAGAFGGSTPGNHGSIGYYWSSTRRNNSEMYLLYMNTSNVNPADYVNREYGYSVRCIHDEPKTISNLTYLQDFNTLSVTDKTSVISSMQDSTTYNLVDNRDNKAYAIAKFKDGNVWMAENLDLGRTDISVALTSTNTNIASSIYASTFNGWRKTSSSYTYTDGE